MPTNGRWDLTRRL